MSCDTDPADADTVKTTDVLQESVVMSCDTEPADADTVKTTDVLQESKPNPPVVLCVQFYGQRNNNARPCREKRKPLKYTY